MTRVSRGRVGVAAAGAFALLASLSTPTLANAADPTAAADVSEPNDLIFSEYVEGSSNNKALEIYNGTGASVDLSAYSIQQYSNGAASAGITINLTGTLPAGEVHVVAHSSAAPAILAVADQTSGAGLFNGDDALTLRHGSTVIDSIGQVGVDPGTEWGSGLTSTADNTLRRKSDVCTGDVNPGDAFDPALEWDGFAQDTFDGLGSHTASCGGGEDVAPFISEIHYDNAGVDVGEAIEVQAPVGTDLTGWSIVLYNGSNNAPYDTRTLSGTVPEAGVVVAEYPTDGIQNGAPDAVALVDADGTVVEFLSYEGVLTALGGPADGLTSSDIGVAETSSTPIGQSLQKVDGVWTGPLEDTFGARNDSGPVDPGDPTCEDPTPIGTVQGSGDASSMTGAPVCIEGVVVGDFQHESSLNGYYVQDAGDGNPATSDGIFVYAPSGADVSVGDQVRVSGTVSEFFGMTQVSLTGLEVVATGTALPAATRLVLPVDNHEAYEGMLVTFEQDLAILEYFNYGRYGEIVLGIGDETFRQYQPTAVYTPGSAQAEALAAFNRAHRITVDDGLGIQNPPTLRHPNGEPFGLDNLFRGGDTVSNLTGVMDYRNNAWKIQPTVGADYEASNPRPAVPEVGGTTTVASFNVLNYFTTLTSQDSNARGADTPEEFARQQAKIVAAINAMDADVTGLIEIENNGDVAVGNLVEALNAAAGSQKWAFVSTGKVGTDAITTAFIYQPAQVTPVAAHAVLDSSVDPRFLDDLNRPALAQTFEDNAIGGQVTVIVNHLKSKGSACSAVGDPEDPDGQGNCNGVRTAAADALGDWANDDPTGTGTDNVLIIGDLNSYDKEDPIQALAADGFTDLLRQFQGEYAYSYVFDGMLGYLDYAMSSEALTPQVTGADAWTINADEPSILDYDMSFKPPAQDAIFAPDAFRSSDHDPVLIGLDLTPPDTIAPELEVIASPSTVWPPNNKWVTVNTVVTATDNSGEQPTITLVGATVTDPGDNGQGAIEVVSDSQVRVKAVKGAVYTITYEATDAAGNTSTESVTVTVGKPGKGGQ